jgi:3-hydroxyacyl-[acyl-carrier-protein] dehydratase
VIVFSGMDNVRFRGQVKPGDRVWFVGKATRINRRKNEFAVQGFVGGKMVFEAEVFGMPFTPAVTPAPLAP